MSLHSRVRSARFLSIIGVLGWARAHPVPISTRVARRPDSTPKTFVVYLGGGGVPICAWRATGPQMVVVAAPASGNSALMYSLKDQAFSMRNLFVSPRHPRCLRASTHH